MRRIWGNRWCIGLLCAAAFLSGEPVQHARMAYVHALPKLDGGHLQASIVEVTYGPGGSSMPHSHPCPVIGYVLEGAVRMQVKGGEEKIYRAGQSFYEAPNGVHEVSANASSEKPARFLAYFVCDRDTPLSVPAEKSRTQ
jgi:quercetin dioxygenase-like cupin family protein